MLSQLWNKLDSRARMGFSLGVVLILGLTAALAWWTLRQDEGVLFSGLSPQDASAMVAELDRMKQPYRLDHDGSTILVPAETVHRIRLQLMGQDIPLHGTVGFELFNNSDFGMTEFTQKVNYQRAMQGEITRTIMSLDGIQAARVHLAVPEQGLFKRAGVQPKASVTLTLKPDHQLTAEQVRGIQRLVASSVAEIQPQNVTIVDQNGVALTRVRQDQDSSAMAEDLIEQKRSLEGYYTRKLDAVLERSFGMGKVIASVDVLFSDKRVKQTTEDVLPADKESGAGVLIRERQTSRPASGDASGGDEVTQSETDYQVGRRVEQVERGPGGVDRISVAVVVRSPLQDAELARLKEIVGNTVGLVASRGDSVAVYPMSQLTSEGQPPAQVPAVQGVVPPIAVAEATVPIAAAKAKTGFSWSVVGAVLLVLIALTLLVNALRRPAMAAPNRLSDNERERALQQVRHWISADRPTALPREDQA
ncbi:flagellar basal-body MS-ring/collar protein FliF [Chitinimonas sp. JJ19]|uniref:flagellar basal-body MS-ring/collar protein FliF n=1 Tax=Chitinimonas sp. JJ19 TaxID=3109352 RepID=UPI0030037216